MLYLKPVLLSNLIYYDERSYLSHPIFRLCSEKVQTLIPLCFRDLRHVLSF